MMRRWCWRSINGFDAQDDGSIAAPFGWDATRSATGLRVGYIAADFTDDARPRGAGRRARPGRGSDPAGAAGPTIRRAAASAVR